MNRIVLFIILSLFVLLTKSQTVKNNNTDTINYMDKNKLKQGLWVVENDGGSESGFYKDNLKNGTWITYHKNKTLHKIESFNHGIENGVFLTIDESGNYIEKNYLNGILNGPYREFGPWPYLALETTYKSGQMHGKKIVYYNDQKIQEESYYNYGLKEDTSKWYNVDGNLIVKYFYKKGNLEGIQKTYYPNGNIMTEQNYVNNIMEGEYKEFYENEKLKVKGNYIQGLKDGLWQEFAEDGVTVTKTSNYQKGNIIK